MVRKLAIKKLDPIMITDVELIGAVCWGVTRA